MNDSESISLRNRIIGQHLDESDIQNNEALYGQYTIVSANLSNYLPDIDPEAHMKLFVQLLTHKRLSKLEQGASDALSYLHAENLTTDKLELLKKSPSIFCTFHTGSYRIINSFLVQHKIPFSLVIGGSIIAAEGKDYLSLYQNLSLQVEKKGFNIIDAENPKSGLQMLRELKQGRSLLLYMDGNSGSGIRTTQNDNSCLIDFLNQQLFARKGIGFLAHAADVPIIPAINYRPNWDDIRLRFYDAIIPDQDENRETFANRVTQQLYDMLALVVKQYPEQWEAWLYLHKVANISNALYPTRGKTRGKFVRFNLKSYGVFRLDKRSFLFRKDNYTSYSIKTSLYKKLRESIKTPVDINVIDKEILIELEENGVLHYL